LNAAEKGHLNAQYITGINYIYGIGVEKDEEKGFEWLSIAASHDYPPAIYGVGRSYELGLGVAQDFEKAYDYFAKAAHLYDLDAIFSLMEEEEEEEDDEEV
ncbi:sel1 repeat family protein, partial [Methanocorpusculum sp.]|nr:sel1 repeat family protein [Methanocorpusculum sp.]